MEHTEPIPITQAVDEWLTYIRRLSKNTQLCYSLPIRRFAASLPSSVQTIDQIRCSHIQHHLDCMLGSCSNKTVNTRMVAVRSFCKWAEECYDLPNPTKKLKKLPEHSVQRVLTKTEYQQVLAVCSDREKDIIQFLANTGLRAFEFLSLTTSNITPDGKFLSVVGKGSKRREIPLNETCRQIIERNPDLQFSKNYLCLWRTCKRLARCASIPNFGPHAVRHWFATQLMRRCEKGVSIYRISKILGHSSVTTTEKLYLHFVDRIDLEGLTDCLD